MILEERLNTRFDNLSSTNTNSKCPLGKEFTNSDQGIQGRYEKYTPLNISREKKSTKTVSTYNSRNEEYDPLTY